MAQHDPQRLKLRRRSIFYRLLVSSVGLSLLAVSFHQAPSTFQPAVALLVGIFVFLQVNFPLFMMDNEISLAHMLVLGAGMLYGGPTVGIGALVGSLVGHAIRPIWPRRMAPNTPSMERGLLNATFRAGMLNLALAAGWAGSGFRSQVPETHFSLDYAQPWLPFLVFGLVFILVHACIWLVDTLLLKPDSGASLRKDWRNFLLLECSVLPFTWVVILTFPVLRLGTLITAGLLPLLLAVLLYGMLDAGSALQNRIRELTTLNQVSEVLRSTLDLDGLLSSTYEQVHHLLGVDNFYVALYDAHDSQIWYPLAVKRGERQNWAPRPLTDRLTDRVIFHLKPLIYQKGSLGETGVIDLPPSQDTPTAWIGVPLQRSDRVIGCLCIFSLVPDAEYSPEVLRLLEILSGQISVALDNSLLYEQAQRRLAQLENLNRISNLISASLDPEEVLAQVCQSVSLVGGGERSAIFLVDPDKGQIWMAYAHELSDEFVQANLSFSIAQEGRTHCLSTGQPDISSDVRYTELDAGFRESLLKENILAMGDFPLTTPEGQIGYLSVYHNQAHKFRPEEEEILQTFASEAAIAVSNARLYARTDIALSRRVRQLSILEAVGRELAANLHSEQLFEIILNYALEYTSSRWGSLGLYDPQNELIHIKAASGYPRSYTTISVQEGISGRAVLSDEIQNVGDVRLDAQYLDLSDGQARAHLSIPLTFEGRVLGVLTLEKPELNAYSESDESFIGQLAVQAAIAVVNAELYAEIQLRLREQSTLYLVSSRLVGDRDLSSVLGTIQRAIQAALEPVACGAYLWVENEQHYQLQTLPNTDSGLTNLQTGNLAGSTRRSMRLPMLIQAGSLGSLFPQLLENVPIHLQQADELPEGLQGQDYAGHQALLLPLVIHAERLGLFLFFLKEGRSVREDELQLVNAIATQGAISVQNALLFSDISAVRDRLAAVLNSVREGIVMVEMDGRVSLVNESVRRITGLLPAEIENRLLTSLSAEALAYLGYTRADAYALTNSMSQGPGSGDPKATYRVGSAQAERYLERLALPVWGGGRRAEGWMIVLRDVTEEHQVAETRKLITETLVHDLRSPLSAVVSAIDVMEDSLKNEARAEILPQAIQVARRGSARVLGMVESLLDIARLQSGAIELIRMAVDLQAVVDSILVEFLPQSQDYGVILRNEIPSGLVVNADLHKITRVLTNLLDNALKFTPPGGQIVFSAVGSGEMVEIRVSDTGPGIPAEFREKIFDQFAQVPGQRGRRRGSGLGLTFCRLAIEAHGGRIWVESPPGGGSVFIFTLPTTRLTSV